MRQLWMKIADGAVALAAPGLTAAFVITSGLCAGLGVTLAAPDAFAQQRMIPIPLKAKRAAITFNGTPEVLVDGKAARLAPGARITDRNNMLILPGALNGTATAKYTLEDTTGMLMQVWILTEREIATPDPKP
jgi:hypothetical protein